MKKIIIKDNNKDNKNIIDELYDDNFKKRKQIDELDKQIKKIKKDIDKNIEKIQHSCDHKWERICEYGEHTSYECVKCEACSRRI